MPKGSLQTKRYSQAIFKIAQEHNTLDKWSDDLQQIATLARHADLVAMVDNPRFPFEDKSKLISAQLESAEPLVLNLVNLLISRGKFGLISDIYSEYCELLDKHRGIEKAEVTTAVPLEEIERIKLIARLETMTGKRIVLTTNIDPGIIGGIVIRVGGKLIEGSTRNQLAALRSDMIGRTR